MAPMATLGLLGGTSWESTVLYYQHINRSVRQRLGGLHSAPLLLHSVDFAEFHELQKQGQWEEAGKRFGSAAKGLVDAGAQAVMMCCNTFHVVADDVQKAAGVELIHIVHATMEKIKERGLSKVILLGSTHTMEGEFFRGPLQRGGIDVVIPNKEEGEEVHRVILEELAQGIVRPESKKTYLDIIKRLVQQDGAQGVVAGCTEIGMLSTEEDAGLPVFDTAIIHAEKAVEWALAHGQPC